MGQSSDLEAVTGSTRVVRTVCDRCHSECGVLVHVRDGKVIKVEGGPTHPANEGAMCAKGLAVAVTDAGETWQFVNDDEGISQAVQLHRQCETGRDHP